MRQTEEWETIRLENGQLELRRRPRIELDEHQPRITLDQFEPRITLEETYERRIKREQSHTPHYTPHVKLDTPWWQRTTIGRAAKAAGIAAIAGLAIWGGSQATVNISSFLKTRAAEARVEQAEHVLGGRQERRRQLDELEATIERITYHDHVPADGMYFTMQSVPVGPSIDKQEYVQLKGLEAQLMGVGLGAEHMKVTTDDGTVWTRMMAPTSYRTLLDDYQHTLDLPNGNGWKHAHVIEVEDGKTKWFDFSNLDYNENDARRVHNLPYANSIATNAQAANVSPVLLATILNNESGFNPNAVSHTGVIGIAQITKDVANDRGVNRHTLDGNMLGGARQLRWLLNQYDNDFYLTVAGYNAGKAAVDQSNAGTRVLKDEAHEYVPRAIEVFNKLRRNSNLTRRDLTMAKDSATAQYRGTKSI